MAKFNERDLRTLSEILGVTDKTSTNILRNALKRGSVKEDQTPTGEIIFEKSSPFSLAMNSLASLNNSLRGKYSNKKIPDQALSPVVMGYDESVRIFSTPNGNIKTIEYFGKRSQSANIEDWILFTPRYDSREHYAHSIIAEDLYTGQKRLFNSESANEERSGIFVSLFKRTESAIISRDR